MVALVFVVVSLVAMNYFFNQLDRSTEGSLSLGAGPSDNKYGRRR